MASLFKDMQRVLNEREPPRRFTDVSDEKKGKLCDPQTPFHEWESLSHQLLTEKLPLVSLLHFLPATDKPLHMPRWDFDEVCSELTFKPQYPKRHLYRYLVQGLVTTMTSVV